MKKLDEYVHAVIDGIDGEEIDVWEDQGWKFAPAWTTSAGEVGEGGGGESW